MPPHQSKTSAKHNRNAAADPRATAARLSSQILVGGGFMTEVTTDLRHGEAGCRDARSAVKCPPPQFLVARSRALVTLQEQRSSRLRRRAAELLEALHDASSGTSGVRRRIAKSSEGQVRPVPLAFYSVPCGHDCLTGRAMKPVERVACGKHGRPDDSRSRGRRHHLATGDLPGEGFGRADRRRTRLRHGVDPFALDRADEEHSHVPTLGGQPPDGIHAFDIREILADAGQRPMQLTDDRVTRHQRKEEPRRRL